MSPDTRTLILVVLLTTFALGPVVFLVIRFLLRADASRARITALEELMSGGADGSVEPSPELRADLSRRIEAELAAAPRLLPGGLDRLSGRLTGRRLMIGAATVLAGVIALSAIMLAIQSPTPPATSAATPASSTTGHPGGGDVQQMIGELEQKLKAQPDDAPGWGMLGWSYFQTARYDQAARAYQRASKLDPKNGEYLSALGESIVRATGGQVNPEAQAAFRRALDVDPGDPRARYFLAVLKDQNGDHAGAMHDWIELVRTAPEGAPWAAEIRAFVIKIAKSRGQDITDQLPASGPKPSSPVTEAAAPGPTADQVAAAGQMSDADRQAMIAGMVDKLAERLRTQPNDADGWMRLVRARMVQGRPDEAGRAYHQALPALAADPAHRAELKALAQQLGVPGV